MNMTKKTVTVISTMVEITTTLLIMTIVLNMDISQGQAQTRTNPPHKMGDCTERYWKSANEAPTMMVNMADIYIYAMGNHQ